MDIPAWTHDVFSLSKNTYFPHRPLQDLKSANVLTLNCPRSLERVCAHAHHSVVSNSATPWTTAHKALLSMEFSRQECTAVDAIPTPEDLPDPGIIFCVCCTGGGFFTTAPHGEAHRPRGGLQTSFPKGQSPSVKNTLSKGRAGNQQDNSATSSDARKHRK